MNAPESVFNTLGTAQDVLWTPYGLDEGRVRKAFDLQGTPLRIEMKTTANPYADKEPR